MKLIHSAPDYPDKLGHCGLAMLVDIYNIVNLLRIALVLYNKYSYY